MNKLDFSIIIPVFNQEKYIKQCVESALNQEFEGTYEIIIINDGSNDKSEEILKEFNSDRLKIFNNKNSGAAFSRNTGTKEASGEYIVYLDSDDILEKNALQNFYDTNRDKNADIIQGAYYAIRENKNDLKFYFPLEKFKDKKGFLNIQNTKGEVLCGNFEPWGKAYRKDFILDNKIEFQEGASLAEDLPFFYRAIIEAEKIILCKKAVYYYRRGHKAIKKGRADFIPSVILALEKSDEIVKGYKNFKDIEKIYAKNCLNICLFWYRKFRNLEGRKDFYAFCVGFLRNFNTAFEFRLKSFINNLIDIL